MRKNGFSMIEVVIAITILGVVGVFVSTILTRSYNAGNQSNRIGRLKQNGQVAIDIMAEAIRSSEGVVCYGGPTGNRSEIVVRTLEGKYVKYKFLDPCLTGSNVTSNGYIVKQEGLSPTNYSSFCSPARSQSCAAAATTPPEIPLTNTDSLSGVSISNGKFDKLTPTTSSKDTVMISFHVSGTLTATSSAESNTALMQTTVQVR